MNGTTSTNAYWPTPADGSVNLQGNCPSNCNNYYMHKDWLGSARIVSGVNSHADISDLAFAPYGEIYAQFGVKGPADQMFTGDTEDVVAGTMETPNREYNNSAQGRWISPDPAGAGWNTYAYGTNPNSEIDPSGLIPCCGPGGSQAPIPTYIADPCAPSQPIVPPRFHCQGLVGEEGMDSLGALSGQCVGECFYQNQVDCAFNPGSCLNGPSRTVGSPSVTVTVTNSYQGQTIGGISTDGTQWWYATGPIFPITNPDGSVGFTATPWMPSDTALSQGAAQIVTQVGALTAVPYTGLEVAFGAETLLLPGLGEIGAAGDIADYDTYVIGRLPDTATWEGVPFTNVLNTPAWDLNVQAEWEATAVQGGQPITLASPITEQTVLNPGNPDGFSVFGTEVSNFLNLGYTWEGNFLLPQ